MFTVKLYSRREGVLTQFISCPNFSVFERDNGNITITVYKTMTCETGVDYHIHQEDGGSSGPQRYFENCFIENEAGKTIARYSCEKELLLNRA